MKDNKKKCGFAYLDGKIRCVEIIMKRDGEVCVEYEKEIPGHWLRTETSYAVIEPDSVYKSMCDCQQSRLVPDVEDLKDHRKWATIEINNLNEELNKIKRSWVYKLLKLICKDL